MPLSVGGEKVGLFRRRKSPFSAFIDHVFPNTTHNHIGLHRRVFEPKAIGARLPHPFQYQAALRCSEIAQGILKVCDFDDRCKMLDSGSRTATGIKNPASSTLAEPGSAQFLDPRAVGPAVYRLLAVGASDQVAARMNIRERAIDQCAGAHEEVPGGRTAALLILSQRPLSWPTTAAQR